MKHLFTLLLLSLLLTSCVDKSQKLIIRKNGSGEMSTTTYMSEQMISLSMMDHKDTTLTWQEQMIQDFTKTAKAVQSKTNGALVCKDVVYLEEDDKKGFNVRYTFDDITQIVIPYNMDALDDNYDPTKLVGKATFQKKRKNIVVTLHDSDKPMKAPEEQTEEQKANTKELMEQMLKGFQYDLTIVVDGKFTTDATHVKDNDITILSLNFEALMNSEGGYNLMESTGDVGLQALKSLDAAEGASVQQKNQFEITFK